MQRSTTIDFDGWYRGAFGKNTPWGETDHMPMVADVESDLERRLSEEVMGGRKLNIRRLEPGKTLVEQGDQGTDLFLVVDGVLGVEVDGEQLAEVGPGAILGERAQLEGGRRKATLRALTPVKAAVMPPDRVTREALEQVATGHRREEQR
jgi:CRP-like cAMP-binding protein